MSSRPTQQRELMNNNAMPPGHPTPPDDDGSLQDRMRRGELTLDDFIRQMEKMLSAGGIKKWLTMIPGLSEMLTNMDLSFDGVEILRMKAIVQSMTPKERR